MTSTMQSRGTIIAAPDLEARVTNIGDLIEQRLKDVLDIPETLNLKQVLILARMAKRGSDMSCMGDLIRLGIYAGSNVHYNLSLLIKHRYVEELNADVGDKRRRGVRLTKHGELLGKEAAAELDRIEKGIGECFSMEKYTAACLFLAQGTEEPARQERQALETA
jgi:DNA-binding MarR family transcriptional regulator